MSYLYLCGQITGLGYKDATFGWRAQVYDALKGSGIECISPMRGKTHLLDVKDLSPLGAPDSVESNAKAITTRDRFDIRRPDLLFCNLLGMDRVSIGSMIEFGWADAFRVPILCCIEPDGGNLHEHGIVQDLIGWRRGSLEEGMNVVYNVLKTGL